MAMVTEMRKDELEDRLMELEIEQKVDRRLKRAIQLRCSAVVSSVLAGLGMLGAWANENSDRLAAALQAFWKGGGQ